MNHFPIDITLGKSIYSVRINTQDRDHFYELVRQGHSIGLHIISHLLMIHR